MGLALNPWLAGRFAKPVVFLMALLPFGWLVFAAAFDRLGANPAEALERSTGDWTLRMLCVVLAVTPLRTVFALTSLARFRRMLGLFVYFYAMLHLVAYSWFDMGFEPGEIGADIVKRPFILVGFLAVLLLTPLAFTSFNAAIRFLGGRRWHCCIFSGCAQQNRILPKLRCMPSYWVVCWAGVCFENSDPNRSLAHVECA